MGAPGELADLRPPGGSLEVHLSDDQIRSFWEHGYLVIDRVTTDEELEWLREVWGLLFGDDGLGHRGEVYETARPFGDAGPALLTQLIRPEVAVPGLRATNLVRNACRVGAQLLDLPADELDHWGHMVHKPARVGEVTPWHQDEAYWDPAHDHRAVGTWVPLDDVDESNGCLWFLPASHREEVHRHVPRNGDPAVRLLELDAPFDPSAAVPVPLAAGGMTVHAQRTLHHAGPNRTDRPRRAYANEVQAPPVAREVPHDRPWLADFTRAVLERMAGPAATT